MITIFPWLGIAAVIGVLGFLLQSQDESERKRAMRHMQDRQPFTPKAFGLHYFSAHQGDIAEQVAAIFAKHISIDTSRVHPDDKLVEELRMDALDSMSTVEFVVDLEKHFKISIPNSAASEMRTLRDITTFVSHALQQNQSV